MDEIYPLAKYLPMFSIFNRKPYHPHNISYCEHYIFLKVCDTLLIDSGNKRMTDDNESTVAENIFVFIYNISIIYPQTKRTFPQSRYVLMKFSSPENIAS